MKHTKKVTIYDIAAALNVAPSTVSRALKDDHSIGKKTTTAVKKMAMKKGYTTNFIAAGLRTKKTKNIGIVIPWIDTPFYTGVINGIELEINETEYNFMTLQSYDSYQRELINIQKLSQNSICGLIISPCSEPGTYDHLSKFRENEIPVVMLNNSIPEWDSYCISIDNYQVGYTATSHLIYQGCKRIAFVGGNAEDHTVSERERGYRSAMATFHLSVNEDLVIYNRRMTNCDGQKSAGLLFSNENIPDGVVTCSDSLATGIIQYAKNIKIKIPDDLAIIGFNNEPISRVIEPSLSTFDVPAVEMGRAAIHKILSPGKFCSTVNKEWTLFKTPLIIRDSTQHLKLNNKLLTN